MIQLTENAIGKVREILDTQEPKPAGLRRKFILGTLAILAVSISTLTPIRSSGGQ